MAADALHPTGALAAILFILALLATPLRRIWPRGPIPLWLLRNRRFGGYSFGYAYFTLFTCDTGSG